MPADLQSPPDHSMTSLVNGIVHDFQDLIEQQIRLARKDLETGFNKVKEAGLMFGIGAACMIPGALGFFLMLAHLVHWLSGGADTASIPLWGCYAIAAVVFTIAGVALVLVGKKQVNTMPDQAVKGLEENLEWKTNQTSLK